MVRVKISTPQRTYETVIDNGLLQRAGESLLPLLGNRRRLFVVTVRPVRRRWGKALMNSLSASGFLAQFIEMPSGERYKRLATLEGLCDALVKAGADRNAVVLTFGGGIVGDVGAFLASVYMRGIDVVQIPTTVQAQVDAAIGGKTGVNLRSGKNLVGTFHQPLAVLIDPETLSTLPEREFRSGLYESLKAGVIGLPKLFDDLERVEIKKLRRDRDLLASVIADSVKLKAEVVSADEREGDLRRVLNLGHTIGHALEAQTKYCHFLHGEAVAWGMIAASNIAKAVGKLSPRDDERIRRAVLGFGALPPVQSRTQGILDLLKSDKKTRDGVVHFVLPTQIGKVEIVNDLPVQVVSDAVDELRALSHKVAAS